MRRTLVVAVVLLAGCRRATDPAPCWQVDTVQAPELGHGAYYIVTYPCGHPITIR